jgi:hypothetical protein
VKVAQATRASKKELALLLLIPFSIDNSTDKSNCDYGRVFRGWFAGGEGWGCREGSRCGDDGRLRLR